MIRRKKLNLLKIILKVHLDSGIRPPYTETWKNSRLSSLARYRNQENKSNSVSGKTRYTAKKYDRIPSLTQYSSAGYRGLNVPSLEQLMHQIDLTTLLFDLDN